MDSIERLPFRDAVADFLEEVHSSALINRSAGEARDAGNAIAVDRPHAALHRCWNFPHEMPKRIFGAGTALPLDHRLHMDECGTRGQQRLRTPQPVAAVECGIEVEDTTREEECPFAQVGGGIGVIAQDLHHVARFEHRTDAATDRLRPVRHDDVDCNADLPRHIFEELA